MVLALHGVVLEYLRRHLSSELIVVTPMPQPLLVHVLRPAVAVLPPPVVRQPAKTPRPVIPPPSEVAAEAPDGGTSVADEAIPPVVVITLWGEP